MRTRKEKRNIERWDLVDGSIFELIKTLNPTGKEIEYDSHIINRIRLDIQNYLVNELKMTKESIFYP